MHNRKNVAWGLLLAVGMGLVVVLVSLGVEAALQPSLEERIAAAGERLRQKCERVDRLREEPYAGITAGLKTREEAAKEFRLADAKNEARRQALRKALEERQRAFDELCALEDDRGRRYNSWPVRLRWEVRRRTGW